jgi:hypothetical protein
MNVGSAGDNLHHNYAKLVQNESDYSKLMGSVLDYVKRINGRNSFANPSENYHSSAENTTVTARILRRVLKRWRIH